MRRRQRFVANLLAITRIAAPLCFLAGCDLFPNENRNPANGNDTGSFGATWAKSYGSTGVDRAEAVVQTSDGGYIMVGTRDGELVASQSRDFDEGDVWVQKLDANGDVEWARAYGDHRLGVADGLSGSIARRTADGGFIVAGSVNVPDDDPLDSGEPLLLDRIRLAKLDARGHVRWARTHEHGRTDLQPGEEVDERPKAVYPARDGGYVVVGVSILAVEQLAVSGSIRQGALRSAFVARFTAAGDMLWRRTFDLKPDTTRSFGTGGSDDDPQEEAFAVTETADGGFVVVGDATDPPSDDRYGAMLVLRLNGAGDVLFSIPARSGGRFDYSDGVNVTGDLPARAQRALRDVAQIPRADGTGSEYALAGCSFDDRQGALLLTLNETRDTQTESPVRSLSEGTVFDSTSCAQAVLVEPQPGGALYLAGSTPAIDVGFVLKLDASHNVIWRRDYAGFVASDLAFGPDGTLWAAGGNHQSPLGSDGYVVLQISGADGAELSRRRFDSIEVVDLGRTSEAALSIDATGDGFVVAGSLESSPGHRVLRADRGGSVLWYHGARPEPGQPAELPHHTDGRDRGLAVAIATDGGYLVAAETRANLAEHAVRVWLLRLELDGRVRWQRVHELAASPFIAYGLRPVEDGYYLFGGDSVLRLDSEGNVRGRYDFGFCSFDNAGCIAGLRVTRDGGAIIARNSADGPRLIRLDRQGVVQWQRSYASEAVTFNFDDVELAHDSGYVTVGTTGRVDDPRDVWVLNVDADGTPRWQYSYGGEGLDSGVSIAATPDRGYVLAARTASFGTTENCQITATFSRRCESIWVLKLNEFGRQGTAIADGSYDRVYTTRTGARAFQVIATRDGGALVAGETDGIRTGIRGDTDAWLLKLGPGGDISGGCPSGVPSTALHRALFAGTSAIAADEMPFVQILPAERSETDIEPLASPIEVARQCSGAITKPPRFGLGITLSGNGRVTSQPAGIDCGADCSEIYETGTAISLTVTPGPLQRFEGWSGDADCSDGQVTMDAPKHCIATFGELPAGRALLTVQLGGAGVGTVSGSGIACGNDCNEDYARGTLVTLTATPGEGSTFAAWTGCDAVRGNDCDVTMPTFTRNVSARFEAGPRFLTVTRAGTGSGVITGPGIACPEDCSESYAAGTTVTLRAVPDAGSSFQGWANGCGSIDGDACTVTMNAARTVTAVFQLIAQQQFALDVTRNGEGEGTVAGPGIDCGIDCEHVYDEGTSVTLTATARQGSSFAGWSGCQQVNINQCTVTMSQSRLVTATFDLNPSFADLTLVRAGDGASAARVFSDPQGIDCGDTCSARFLIGSQASLSPTAGSPSLQSWQGCDSVSGGACRVTINGPRTITASFDAPGFFTLTVQKDGSGDGTVTSQPAGIDCGSDCRESYASGTFVSLFPRSGPGSQIAGWTGCDQVVDGICGVDVNSARTVVVRFN